VPGSEWHYHRLCGSYDFLTVNKNEQEKKGKKKKKKKTEKEEEEKAKEKKKKQKKKPKTNQWARTDSSQARAITLEIFSSRHLQLILASKICSEAFTATCKVASSHSTPSNSNASAATVPRQRPKATSPTGKQLT
jgi:uncharacterized membrane protein YdbT with pleckstrin-like domain